MTEYKKERVEEILEKAMELHQSQRSQYVREACGSDAEIFEEVDSLLDADKERSLKEFLDEGLPAILKSAARRDEGSRVMDEAQKLKREEAEEKKRWEGEFVGENRRYQILALRRFGLMASLFFGKDTKINNGDVVIKIPRTSAYTTGDEDDAEQQDVKANIRNNFRREFDSLAKLRGCNYVVQVLDLDVLPDGRPFMVQEFLPGNNAYELLAANKDNRGNGTGLGFKQVANIIRQAGYGLAAAHELGILHRDMKAENIMISRDGATVKLIDFNAADVKLPISPMSTVFKHLTWGTLGFVSPEQLRIMLEPNEDGKAPELTSASDVYSLAITAYLLLTSKLPFSLNLTDLIKQQVDCSFQPASELRDGLTPEIDRLLRQALDYNPPERPQSAKEFGEEFARSLESIGTAPTEYPRPFEVPVPQPHPLFLKIALVAMSLVLLLAAGYIFWRALHNEQESVSNTNVPATAQPPASQPPASTLKEPPAPSTSKAPRSFSFWLDLTRASNGKPVDGSSIRASGQEVFTDGDFFVMNFVSPQSGYLYLLNEGRNYKDVTTFYYAGKFPVKENVRVSSEQLGFDDKAGPEKFWLLFSSSPDAALEEYDAPGEIPEDKTEQLRSYLQHNVPTDLSFKEDIAEAQMVVKGSGETIAYKVELRHRKTRSGR